MSIYVSEYELISEEIYTLKYKIMFHRLHSIPNSSIKSNSSANTETYYLLTLILGGVKHPGIFPIGNSHSVTALLTSFKQ